MLRGEAGVSYATVSRVINNEEYVKPETRLRVHIASNQFGVCCKSSGTQFAWWSYPYDWPACARSGTGYIGEIVRGIDGELVNRQYDLMLFTTHWRERREADLVESYDTWHGRRLVACVTAFTGKLSGTACVNENSRMC